MTGTIASGLDAVGIGQNMGAVGSQHLRFPLLKLKVSAKQIMDAIALFGDAGSMTSGIREDVIELVRQYSTDRPPKGYLTLVGSHHE